MTQPPESIELFNRWKAGDEAAAEEIFRRYVNRLAGLARSRLSERMQVRVDAEDVLQSAYRSFFQRAKEGRFDLKRSGDLWRLLAAITIKKTLKNVERHRAGKRNLDRENQMPEDLASSWVSPNHICHEPTADEAVAITDEVETFMKGLEPLEREILEMRLQDRSSDAISKATGVSQVKVRRILRSLKRRLAARLSTVEP